MFLTASASGLDRLASACEPRETLAPLPFVVGAGEVVVTWEMNRCT